MTRHWLTGARTDVGDRQKRPWRHPSWRFHAVALMHRPVPTTSLMTVVVMMALVPSALGQGDPSAGETLRGLTGVNVVVEDLPVAPGLTPATIRADTETQLRDAGIRVLNDDEWQSAPGRPWLFVRVRTIRPDVATSGYAYVISLDLMQRTTLTREPTRQTDAVTWTTGTIGAVGGHTLTPVRERLHAEVDTFIRAYWAVNSAP